MAATRCVDPNDGCKHRRGIRLSGAGVTENCGRIGRHGRSVRDDRSWRSVSAIHRAVRGGHSEPGSLDRRRPVRLAQHEGVRDPVAAPTGRASSTTARDTRPPRSPPRTTSCGRRGAAHATSSASPAACRRMPAARGTSSRCRRTFPIAISRGSRSIPPIRAVHGVLGFNGFSRVWIKGPARDSAIYGRRPMAARRGAMSAATFQTFPSTTC